MSVEKTYRVVILGAGFAGLWAARQLARKKYRKKNIEVLLIDSNNYHTFQPLLYQVAAAELDPGQIAYPIRGIFHSQPNVRCVMAKVLSVDCTSRLVHTDSQDYTYDYLIVAAGCTTAFYGVPGAEEHTFTLKSLEDAVRLRNRLLCCFEEAAQMSPEERPEGLLRVAVVGSGPTGVEYAGALAELIRIPLARDFPELADAKPEVLLIDGNDKPLMGFADRLREYTAKQLDKMGVKLHLGSPVASVTPEGVSLQDGTHLAAYTTVWVAGIQGLDEAKAMGLKTGRAGRIEVLPTLQVAGHPEVQVVGDLALVEGLHAPTVAPNAIQQGTHAAQNILKLIDEQDTVPFAYYDKGSMVSIGRSSAVAQIKGLKFTGFFAWVIWVFVHLAFLIGFRNRIFVFINWAWDYLFFERAVRIILPKEKGMDSKV